MYLQHKVKEEKHVCEVFKTEKNLPFLLVKDVPFTTSLSVRAFHLSLSQTEVRIIIHLESTNFTISQPLVVVVIVVVLFIV